MASVADTQADVFAILERNRQLRDNARSQVDLSVDPQLSQRIGDLYGQFWWMDPNALWSMAKARIAADSPTAQAAATAAAQVRVQTGRGFEQPGTANTTGAVPPSEIERIFRQSTGSPSAMTAGGPALMSQRDLGIGARQLSAPPSPAQQVLGDAWFDLTADDKHQFEQIGFTPESTDGNHATYQVTGLDQLTDNARDNFHKLLVSGDVGRTVTQQGPWALANQYGVGGKAKSAGEIALTRRTSADRPEYQGTDRLVIGRTPVAHDDSPITQLTEGSEILSQGLPIVGKPLQVGFTALAAPLQEVQGLVRDVHQIAYEHELPNFESQSDLGIFLGDLIHGRKADLGTGVFGASPGSPVTQERQRRERTRGEIDGHSVTAGRWLASALPDSIGGHQVFEPGSMGYNLLSGTVDTALALKADPTARALKEVGLSRATSKEFTEPGAVRQALTKYRDTGQIDDALAEFNSAGGIHGIRPTVTRDAPGIYLNAPEQAPLLRAYADAKDAYTIYKSFREPPLDATVIPRLVDAESPDRVSAVLLDYLGQSVQQKPKLSALVGRQFGPRLPGTADPPAFTRTLKSRWASLMPMDHVPEDNLPANLLNLERLGPLVKMPDQDFAMYFDRMARTTNDFQRQAIYSEILSQTTDRILATTSPLGKSLSRQIARDATKQWDDFENVDGVYSMDQIGKGLGSFDSTVVIDGKPITLQSSPHSLAQHLSGGIPMPDWRRIRRDLSALQPVLDTLPVQKIEGFITRTQNWWKTIQIATVKTLMKILGDEQSQFAARGFDTMVNHPVRTMSVILATPLGELDPDMGFMNRLRQVVAHTEADVHFGDDLGWLSMANPKMIAANVRQQAAKGLRGVAKRVPGVEATGVYTHTALADDFENWFELQQLASHGYETVVSDPLGSRMASHWEELSHQPGVNDGLFAEHWAKQLAQFNASPDMRGLMQAGSLEQAQAWYLSGPGKKWRDLLASAGPSRAQLNDDTFAADWVHNSMLQMSAATNDHPDLLHAIADGTLDGVPMWGRAIDGAPQVSKAFVRKLGSYLDDAPSKTRMPTTVNMPEQAYKKMMDGFKDRMLQVTLGTPSAVLTKIPVVRQVYYSEMRRLAPFLTADAQAELVRVAESANVPKTYMDSLQRVITRSESAAAPAGNLTIELADNLAKHQAIKTVEFISDEFTNRSQFFDVWRLWSPFGDVWRRTLYRWGTTTAKNPAVIRRGQQIAQATQGTGMGAVFGGPADQGFFRSDANGQEVFTVPGSDWASQAVTGTPVPFAGRVQGLSLGTEFFPGLGPAASFPVAWTLDKLDVLNTKTPLGTVGDIIFPYGPPRQWNDVVNYMPSWVQKVFDRDRPTSPDNVKNYNYAVMDFLRYGSTNGDYDMTTPAGIQAAIDDASSKADRMYFMRAAMSFFVPGAPSVEPIVRDPSGKILDTMSLVQEFHDMQNGKYPGIDANNAGPAFIAKYGPDIFGAVTPKSYSYIFGIPTSTEAGKWVNDHPTLKRDMPHIYGYFAPPSDPNSFDFDLYRQQLGAGQGRAALSPEQWAKVRNARLAGLQYGVLRDQVDKVSGGNPTDEQLNWLTSKKQQLIDQYPGYSESLYGGLGLPGRSDPRLLVDEARKALADPAAKNTEAGKGLSFYLDLYDQADRNWSDSGYKTGTWWQTENEFALQIRSWLRSKAHRIAVDYPQFGALFENVFDRSMRDDTDPNAPLPGGA